MITKQYIMDEIKKIRKASTTDHNHACVIENRLYLNVMSSVASGDWTAEEIKSRINTALQSQWIEFDRWRNNEALDKN